MIPTSTAAQATPSRRAKTVKMKPRKKNSSHARRDDADQRSVGDENDERLLGLDVGHELLIVRLAEDLGRARASTNQKPA